MKSSKPCPSVSRLFEANMHWSKLMCRTACATALALVLANKAGAQTQMLVNPNWESGTTGWTLINNNNGCVGVANSSQQYFNNAGGECGADPIAENVNVLTGTECAKIYGSFESASPTPSAFAQTFAAAPGSTWSANGFAYSSHEDLMDGNTFHYEVDFYSGANGTGTLLAAYESFLVQNLSCSETTPFAVDAWNGLPVTNVMQVTAGANTGTVIGNISPSGVIVAPAGTASVVFQAIYVNINYGGGSMYLDNATLNQLSATSTTGPAGPTNVVATLGYAANGNAVLISFYQNDNTATGYNLYRSSFSIDGPWTEIATNASGTIASYYTGTNDVMLVDTTAAQGPTAYYYAVQAVNANGVSGSGAAEVLYGQGNQLVNAGFEDGQATSGDGDEGDGIITGWDNLLGDSDDTYGFLNTTANTYCNNCNGADTCAVDGSAETVLIHSGTYCGKLWTADTIRPDYGIFHQTVASPGGTWAAGGWVLDPHEDMLVNVSFNFEVDFLDSGNNLLAAYESYLITNLTCSQFAPFPEDTWVYLNVTNQMLVSNGVNTGIVMTNTGPLGLMVAPKDTAAVTFQATAYGTGSGSSFFDDCVLDAVQAPILTLPSITDVSPSILFSTNTNITCVATSGDSVITNVEVIATTTPLGGTPTVTTYNAGSPGLTLTGLGTATVNVSFATPANLQYQLTIKATDGNGLSIQANTTFDTLQPTLVIEAADFNFSYGGFIDTPADGGLGLYTNAIGVQGVDENWDRNASSPANDSYRPGDNVTIVPSAPNNGIEQKFQNVAGNTNAWAIPQSIGYDLPPSGANPEGDWLNYSRTYWSSDDPGVGSAPAGLYNVYADLAIDGTGAISLYQVTGNTTQSDQTSNLLGAFTLTDSGWSTYEYTPLTDAYGNLVTVNLSSGVDTLRAQVSESTPNVAFFFLVPSVGQAPQVTSVYPTGTEPYGPTNTFTFTLTPGFTAGGASTVSSSDISIILNGVNVSSSLVYSGGTGTIPLAYQNVYTAVITATNSAGLVSVSSVTFNNFDPSNYTVDFSDYDFSTSNAVSGWVSGQFMDDAVPSADGYNTVLAPPSYIGTVLTNSYFLYPTAFAPANNNYGQSGTLIVDPLGIGAVALQGIDIDFPNNGQVGANNVYYRIDQNAAVPGNVNDVGLFPSGDSTDQFRTKYLDAQTQLSDPNIGSFQIGYFGVGNWLNYTRTYPTNNFYVWTRQAGDGGSLSNLLSKVTSGLGTTNQTTEFLGSFAGPQTGNYEVFDWYPLRNTNGTMAVVSLGGKETLRLTHAANPVNIIFLMLVPAPTVLEITPTIVSGSLNLAFPTQSGKNYVVLFKSDLTATVWTQVGGVIPGTGGTVNMSESLSGTAGYYTVEQQ